MGLMSAEEYKASLRDEREVYYKAERVEDVTRHPTIGIAVEHAAIDYRMAESPRHRQLAVVEREGEVYSRYYHVPRSAEDLQKRSQLIEQATALGGTLVVLIKEIGTDALFSLKIVADAMDKADGGKVSEKVEAFYRACRDRDLAVAVAQTDVKGDRSLRPSQQKDPDLYLRIVEDRSDGIVVRGAKMHTSVITNCHEVIVLPTRAMGEGDEDYAVAFAVPVASKGLKLIAAAYGADGKEASEYPISSRHKMMETLTIFDDVFVPKERVFLKRQTAFAGPLALQFVEFHRFTAVSYKLPLIDFFAGASMLAAEANGIIKAGHVREKLIQLIFYAESVRALLEKAAQACVTKGPGIAVPNPLYTNMAKYQFAHHFHEAVKMVQDISGGILATFPSGRDAADPKLGPYVDKFLQGAGVDGKSRLRLMHVISDITTGDFGGYQAVLAVHAEGSLEAEKLAILRAYNPERATAYARFLFEGEDRPWVGGEGGAPASP